MLELNLFRENPDLIKKNQERRGADPKLVDEVISSYKIDKIVHLAAIAGIFTVTKSPVDTFSVIFHGAENIMKASVKNNVDKVVIASTSEVYGDMTFDATEDSYTRQGSIEQSRWIYAISKLAADHLAAAYNRQHGLNVTSVRFFNVYGPGQIGEGAISIFLRKAIKNEDITIFNDGIQVRAWCYIDDMVKCLSDTLDTTHDLAGKAVNIGNPSTGISVYELARLVVDVVKSKSKIVCNNDVEMTDVYVRVPNIDRARNILGFNPKIGLREGIKRTMEWMINNE